LLDREFIELSQMQLQRAGELLSEAAALISFGAYNSSVNRSKPLKKSVFARRRRYNL